MVERQLEICETRKSSPDNENNIAASSSGHLLTPTQTDNGVSTTPPNTGQLEKIFHRLFSFNKQ